jgi:hypothetical protein
VVVGGGSIPAAIAFNVSVLKKSTMFVYWSAEWFWCIQIHKKG